MHPTTNLLLSALTLALISSAKPLPSPDLVPPVIGGGSTSILTANAGSAPFVHFIQHGVYAIRDALQKPNLNLWTVSPTTNTLAISPTGTAPSSLLTDFQKIVLQCYETDPPLVAHVYEASARN